MIVSFDDKESEKIFQLKFARKIPREIQERAYHKLVTIHAAESLDNLRNPPGNRLESLRGDFAGFQSIRINAQWRIVFRWEGSCANEVKITDHH